MQAQAAPIDAAQVKQRTLKSIVAMALRQVLAYGAIYITTIFLSWRLAPATFGVFAIATTWITLLNAFSDLGLGAALVRRPEPPTDEDLRALFTVQIVVFGVVATIATVLAPFITELYDLPTDAAWIVRALALTFWISAFRSIPALLLERQLEFGKIAVVEVSATLVYQLVIIGGVLAGWDVWSIIVASVFKNAIDLFLISRFYPWLPYPTRFIGRIGPLLRFGIGLQMLRLLSIAKDNVAVLLVGPFLGVASVGYLNWALLYAGIPVYFTNLVIRVSFPAFARLQDQAEDLGELVTLTLRFTLGLGLPLILILAIWAPTFVPLIYSSIWLPAIPAVWGLSINMIAGLIVGVLFTLLYSIGDLRSSTILSVVWVGLTYLGALIVLQTHSDIVGISWSYSFATLVITIVLISIVKQRIPLSLWSICRSPMLSVLPLFIAGAAVYSGYISAWIGLALGILVCAGISAYLEYGNVTRWISSIRA